MLFHKKIWRVGDVAKFLGCTVGHVYNLASDEKIPKRKKLGILFFVPEEILNWVLEGDSK
jgi:predicted DNA-binding transcriptional regulator AlpA